MAMKCCVSSLAHQVSFAKKQNATGINVLNSDAIRPWGRGSVGQCSDSLGCVQRLVPSCLDGHLTA